MSYPIVQFIPKNTMSALASPLLRIFIQQCYRTENMRVVSIDTALLIQALELYQSRSDKT
jgi:uncharacterized protein